MTRWKVSVAWPGHLLSVIELGCVQFSPQVRLAGIIVPAMHLHLTCVYYILEAID